MKKFLLAILLLAFASNQGFAQKSYSTKKWEIFELHTNLDKGIDNPFDIIYGAKFVHTSGKEMKVQAFYNGGNEFIIRVCFDEVGEWNYKTYSNLKELSGTNGTVNVSLANPNNYGPITISNVNNRKFQYANGKPYFLMAYECDWLFALDANNNSGIPRTKHLVDEIAANGFNQIVLNIYAYDASFGEKDKVEPEFNFAKPNVFPFLGTNTNPDYSSLNINYFKQFDRVIQYLNKKGIAAHLMIYVWNKKVNWPKAESKADNQYFDYVVKRYQAFPNLIWDISKEALAYGHDDVNYITRRIDRLRGLDAHKRLLSVHDFYYCSLFPDKVDFISIQNWQPNIFDVMLNIYKQYKNKPIFNIEHGGYEKTTYSIFDGAYTDAYECLNRNYMCAFAGTYSTYYWQNSSWYNVNYYPDKLPIDETPKFNYYKNFIKLFNDYNFNNLIPTQYFFSTYSLTNNDDLYLFYVPEHMAIVQGNVKKLKGKKVSIKWFDTITGNYFDGGTKSFNDGTWLYLPVDKRITSRSSVAILKVIK